MGKKQKKESVDLLNEAYMAVMADIVNRVSAVVKEELTSAVAELKAAIGDNEKPAWVRAAEAHPDVGTIPIEVKFEKASSLSPEEERDVKVIESESESSPHISQPSGEAVVTESEDSDISPSLNGSESEGVSPDSGTEGPTIVAKQAMGHIITVGERYLGMTVKEIHDDGDEGIRYLKLLATSSLSEHVEPARIVLDHHGVGY